MGIRVISVRNERAINQARSEGYRELCTSKGLMVMINTNQQLTLPALLANPDVLLPPPHVEWYLKRRYGPCVPVNIHDYWLAA